MNILHFSVNGTDLTLESKTAEQTGANVRADKCCFSFDESWDGYGGRMAYFGADRDRMKPVFLITQADGNGIYYCFIPHSVLAELDAGGLLYISVGASDGAQTHLRTKLYELAVYDGGRAEVFLTVDEQQLFLQQLESSLARVEGKTIQSAQTNENDELIITLENGTVFNLGNVRGPQGAKGDKGDTGATGDTGASGAKGDKGDTGASGAKGDKGDKGDKGETGDKGTGIVDATIADGHLLLELDDYLQLIPHPSGNTIIDCGQVVGAKGDKGDTGATGAQGPKGDKGDTGSTGAAGSDAKQIASVSVSSGGGNNGDMIFTFTDSTSLNTGVNLKPYLPTGTGGVNERYTLQALAAYLYGSDVDSVVADGTTLKLKIGLKGGSYITSDIPVKAQLPTGQYNLQELAVFLFSKVFALESRVSALEALTRVTLSDNKTYTYQLTVDANDNPILTLTEVI